MRLSGPDAWAILERLTGRDASRWTPRTASVALLRDDTGAPVDEALVLPFRGPNSYTGEDLVELHLHGNPVLVNRVIGLALTYGATPADAGAFTRRAVLAGRMGLPEAEALADLIDAVHPLAASQALGRLRGASRTWAESRRRDLTELLAQLEAAVDFPEEPISPEQGTALALRVDELANRLDDEARRASAARVWTRGARLVLLGAPNAGKSTLLNRLVGEQRAIVSQEPGTTRDWVEAATTIGRLPVQLVDTAGLRDAPGSVEREGVERSRGQAAEADLLLLVAAPDAPWPDAEPLPPSITTLRVWNKSDVAPPPTPDWIAVAARDGLGIEALTDAIEQRLPLPEDQVQLGSLRQEQTCRVAAEHVRAAAMAIRADAPPEIVAEELRLAARALDRLLGIIDPEDVLDELFSRFCIGK